MAAELAAAGVDTLEAGAEAEVAAEDVAGSTGAVEVGAGEEADVEAEEADADAAGRRQSAKQKVLCSITISSSCDPECCPNKCCNQLVTTVVDMQTLTGLLDSKHAQECII